MKKTIFILTLLLPICFLFAQNNFSDVDTWGNGNATSFIDQEGVGLNVSYVYQFGNDNSVDVDQLNHLTNFWDANYSNIYQVGDANHAKVDQILGTSADVPFGGPNDALVTQNGYGNEADVQQEGVWNFATTDQDGTNGRAKQYQGKNEYYDAGTPTRYNDAYIWQGTAVGGGSKAEQFQEGTQNDALIHQDSWDNSRAVQIQTNYKEDYTYPFFNNVNVAYINQSGGGHNKAYQVQHYSDVDGAFRNDANAVQIGYDNWSQEVQIGGDNDSDVYQNGNGNSVHVHQLSNGVTDPGSSGLPISY